MQILEQEKKLCRALEGYGRVAVAFSGGADSSLLLWYAAKMLGPENVIAFTSRSCLLKTHELDRVSNWFAEHELPGPVSHHFVDIDPLAWDEFVINPDDRCYRCKSRVYRLFLTKAAEMGISTLIDGTNSDDMQSDRPGLKALHELNVGTPLADAGFSKEAVRSLSREIMLKTWDRPSSSCLATRIPNGMEITRERIQLISRAESVLDEMGFEGCRVRLDPYDAEAACICVQQQDIPRLAQEPIRTYLLEKISKDGLSRVLLDMHGR